MPSMGHGQRGRADAESCQARRGDDVRMQGEVGLASTAWATHHEDVSHVGAFEGTGHDCVASVGDGQVLPGMHDDVRVPGDEGVREIGREEAFVRRVREGNLSNRGLRPTRESQVRRGCRASEPQAPAPLRAPVPQPTRWSDSELVAVSAPTAPKDQRTQRT